MGYRKHHPTRADLIREGIDPDRIVIEGIQPLKKQGGEPMAIKMSSETPKTQQELVIEQALAERAEKQRTAEAEWVALARVHLREAVASAERYIAAMRPLANEWTARVENATAALGKVPRAIRHELAASQYENTARATLERILGLCGLAYSLQADLKACEALNATGKKRAEFEREVNGLLANLNRGNFDPIVTGKQDWETVHYTLNRLTAFMQSRG